MASSAAISSDGSPLPPADLAEFTLGRNEAVLLRVPLPLGQAQLELSTRNVSALPEENSCYWLQASESLCHSGHAVTRSNVSSRRPCVLCAGSGDWGRGVHVFRGACVRCRGRPRTHLVGIRQRRT